MSALIGALRVSLSAETAQFEAGMKRAQRSANQTRSSFQKSFGGLAGVVKAGLAGVISGLSIGLMVQGAKAALEYAGSLGEVSQQLGVTTKDLQVFRFAAGQVGVSQANLETGLSKLTITLGKVAAGAKAPAEALKAIGISVEDLKGKDTGEAFRIIADGLQKVSDRSQRAAVEVALFGKSGAMLDNLLAGGSKAIGELTAAAEELGIVLSDEEIQNADKTADKLDALMTVLKAKIAGDIARNTDSIFGFIDALFELVKAAEDAREAIVNFQRNYNLPHLLFGKGEAFGKNVAGRSVTTDLKTGGSALAIAKRMGLKVAGSSKTSTGPSISQFLAGGGGGGGRAKKDHSADDAARKAEEARRAAFQFDEDLRRGQMDILRARQDLAVSADARAELERQMLDLERGSLQADLNFKVGEGELTKAQAAQILAQQDIVDGLRREAIDQDTAARKTHDATELKQTEYDIKLDALQLESDLATTAKQKRDVELRILDAMEAQERARLEAVLADQRSSELAKQEAQLRLDAISANHASRQQGVINSTRGPLESYFDSLPDTTDEWNEALERVAATGLKAVEDGLVNVITGAESVGDALRSIFKTLLESWVRLQVQSLIGAVGGGFAQGGPVGFASGGWVGGRGTGTSDSIPAMLSNGEFVINAKSTKRFLPLLETINAGNAASMARGGLAVTRTSHVSRMRVDDDPPPRGGMTVHMPLYFTGPVSRETMIQAGVRVRAAVNAANRKGA